MFEGSIVGHRRKDGILEYRVHWDGKTPDEDDWFPRNQLIEEYPGEPPLTTACECHSTVSTGIYSIPAETVVYY